MLTTLRIKNLALVEDLTLELHAGFNAITGETGAGKSIILGALNLVLGERADRSLLRAGADQCSVAVALSIPPALKSFDGFLEANGLESTAERELVLKRTFTSNSTNRQFINGSPTTLHLLAALGEGLVDMHGPHDHQSLFHPARQLAILDAFGGFEPARLAFAQHFRRLRELEETKAALAIDEKTRAQQIDLLRFQAQEIAAARLDPEEETTLEQDYRRVRHAAQLLELAQSALALLNSDEAGLVTQAGRLGRTLLDIQHLDPAAEPWIDLHTQAVETWHDLAAQLSRYTDRVDLDPDRFQALEERLNLLQTLKRKYGPTLADVLAHGQTAAEKLRQLEQRDSELERLNMELVQVRADLWKTGQTLSRQRRKVIPKLGNAVQRQLRDLGFSRSHFEVALTSASASEKMGDRLSPSGLDSIEFLFAPNPGEPPARLRDIASSGEIARVMLALKTVLAEQDQIPVLVFDEVDANIGGETGRIVGEKLREIGRKRQVLCITHLPTVAAAAAHHYRVTKHLRGGRTLSEIRELDADERVEELARMLGGTGKAARQHARALLNPPPG